MQKPQTNTATRMLKLINLSTYQGRITYLAISFLCKTGATLRETAQLTVSDVYSRGKPKKWVRLETQAYSCRMLLKPAAQKLVRLALEVQLQAGFIPDPCAPLFRTSNGSAFTPDELASLFHLYREAAER